MNFQYYNPSNFEFFRMNFRMNDPKTFMFKILILFNILGLFTCGTDTIDKLFTQESFPSTQILTLNTITFDEPVEIISHSKRQTFLSNQPFSTLKQFFGFNITYKGGFKSQWTTGQLNEEKTNIILGKPINTIFSWVICKPTQPQIIFDQGNSSFLIEEQDNLNPPNIITSYEDLLDEDLIVDLWKEPKQPSTMRQRIFIILNDGNLLVATRNLSENVETKFQIKKFMLLNSMRDSQFNSKRYQSQRKLYIFTNSTIFELVFPSDPHIEQFDINLITIQSNLQLTNIKQMDWINLNSNETEPNLAILTKTQFQILSIDPNLSAKIFKPIPETIINFHHLDQYFGLSQNGILQSEMMRKGLHFIKFYYSHIRSALYLYEHNFGLLQAQIKGSNNDFKITATTGGIKQCHAIEFLSQPYAKNEYKDSPIIFYSSCKSYFFKNIVTFKPNGKMNIESLRYRESTIPVGQIILQDSLQSRIIFIKGQTGVIAFKSWNYPKLLYQENYQLDDIYMFDDEFVALKNQQIIVGQYRIQGEKIVCSYNQNYKNYQNLNNQTLPQPNQSQSYSSQLYFEYFSECNSEILMNPPYSLSEAQFKNFPFCRYKMHFTSLSIVQQSKSNYIDESAKQQFWLLVTFGVILLVLILGIVVWLSQKRYITQYIEREGLPVGSQDIYSEPAEENFKPI